MATTRAMGQKPYQRNKKYGRPIRQNPPSPKPQKGMSEQQAIERLRLRNLSPRSKKRVIQGKAPAGYMSLENYGAMLHKAYLETEAEKIQAAYRGMRNRKKVRKMKVNQLEKKALNLAQRRNLLQEEDRLRRYLLEEEDRIRGQLNAMRKNSPSPPRGSMNHNKKIRLFNNNPTYRKKMLELWNKYNPKPRGFSARASRKITQLYTNNGGAKRVRDKKRLYKEKMMKIATEKSPPKRKRPRQAQKPRKKKKPTIAQIQRNLLAANNRRSRVLPKPNAATAKNARRARIEKRRGLVQIKKRYTLPTRTTNSPTIAQIRRRKRSLVLPKPNAATAKNARRARIEKRRGLVQIKKRYTLTDLITGKIKTFTKKGWYDKAVAKHQSLRMRICA